MRPTLYLAWLSHPEDGGYFAPQAREARDHRDWSKYGPLHLSLHTSEEGARAALVAACEAEWQRAELSYAHGPLSELRADLLTYMRRHVGYELSVTEQPVELDAPEPAPGPRAHSLEECRRPGICRLHPDPAPAR